jgi:transposase-like protein
MNIHLHKNATTTPARRAYIQSSKASVRELALELGVTEDTIRRWKTRSSVEDRSHTPHRLQTTLSEAQETIVVELRKTLRLGLDDLLVVTREFIMRGQHARGCTACWPARACPACPGNPHRTKRTSPSNPMLLAFFTWM